VVLLRLYSQGAPALGDVHHTPHKFRELGLHGRELVDRSHHVQEPGRRRQGEFAVVARVPDGRQCAGNPLKPAPWNLVRKTALFGLRPLLSQLPATVRCGSKDGVVFLREQPFPGIDTE
jgi:hypothetical protein